MINEKQGKVAKGEEVNTCDCLTGNERKKNDERRNR